MRQTDNNIYFRLLSEDIFPSGATVEGIYARCCAKTARNLMLANHISNLRSEHENRRSRLHLSSFGGAVLRLKKQMNSVIL